MSHASDAMLARLQAEIEERRSFQDGLVEAAQTDGRDLTEQELELYQRARERMSNLEHQMEPLRESARIANDSARRTTELQQAYAVARGAPAPVEYRTAGEFIMDYWTGFSNSQARERVELYQRAAAHQTTADNLGVIPEPIVAPVINFIDASRPVVTALGPRNVPGGRFNRPKVTQHTD